jgi:hypothetical protein
MQPDFEHQDAISKFKDPIEDDQPHIIPLEEQMKVNNDL